MKIEIKGGRPVSQRDIATLQQGFGHEIDPTYLDFVAKNDGAQPETNVFKIANINESGVNGFIPVNEIYSVIANTEFFPKSAIPVAWAEGGNYVYINVDREGGVFFWDHEKPDQKYFLASNFQTFIEALDPFDIRTIKLKPGQVKKAWIDPDFLKSLEN